MRAMHDPDEFDLAARIRALRDSLGLSQASFANRVGVDQSNVSRWERGAPPDDAHLVRLAELAGQHPAAFRYGQLPETVSEAPQSPHMVVVVGYVGAGQEIFALDDHALGAGLEEVEAPEGVGRETMVAVRVRGESMHPLRNGWLLFYRRDQHGVPEVCLNRLCIVKVADDGPILVKELRRGYRAGHFVLSSWNAPPLEDVRL
ncbi:MAG: helix-turn-helix domain-containing protein, partial [Acidobacteria bacterium]|nr:helix-turn-helix domain-containing protein [Acidobacteriota bacterium]